MGDGRCCVQGIWTRCILDISWHLLLWTRLGSHQSLETSIDLQTIPPCYVNLPITVLPPLFLHLFREGTLKKVLGNWKSETFIWRGKKLSETLCSQVCVFRGIDNSKAVHLRPGRMQTEAAGSLHACVFTERREFHEVRTNALGTVSPWHLTNPFHLILQRGEVPSRRLQQELS